MPLYMGHILKNYVYLKLHLCISLKWDLKLLVLQNLLIKSLVYSIYIVTVPTVITSDFILSNEHSLARTCSALYYEMVH